MFCGSSLKGQTLYNVPPSVENLRIDVEKCVNEHSEQMLSLLALLQDNRRGSVTEAGDDDGDDIYIMVKCLFVCMFVTKNHHFLLGVSCNHPG